MLNFTLPDSSLPEVLNNIPLFNGKLRKKLKKRGKKLQPPMLTMGEEGRAGSTKWVGGEQVFCSMA
jgi:hypothetical protein